jgi:hypothetical protein
MSTTSGRTLIAAIIAVLATAATDAGQPIALKASPPMRQGVAAFPRLVATPGDQAAARINGALQQADDAAVAGMCKDYKRRVSVTMRGPRYLGLFASDNWFCGGAYPDDSARALVYDLATGAPADWKAILAAVPVENAEPEAGDGAWASVLVTSAALWDLYAKRASQANGKECAEVFADAESLGNRLMVWPDAKADGLGLQAWDWPHVVKACAAPVTVSVADLRKLGVQADFLDAIDEAHRRGWFGKP